MNNLQAARRSFSIYKIILSTIFLCCLQGCSGCDPKPVNEPGARTKTSMAGQPEEYLDATRLDQKEDSISQAVAGEVADSTADSLVVLDTFEILTDTPEDPTGVDIPDGHSGPK